LSLQFRRHVMFLSPLSVPSSPPCRLFCRHTSHFLAAPPAPLHLADFQTLEILPLVASPQLPLSIWRAESRLTPPFSETWPSLAGGGLINPSLRSLVRRRRPSANSFTLLNSLLAEGEADVCCCGFRCRLLSRTWWSRTCGLLRISPQCAAGAHTPRFRFALFSRPGLTRTTCDTVQ
jgi:hypothetical protein